MICKPQSICLEASAQGTTKIKGASVLKLIYIDHRTAEASWEINNYS